MFCTISWTVEGTRGNCPGTTTPGSMTAASGAISKPLLRLLSERARKGESDLGRFLNLSLEWEHDLCLHLISLSPLYSQYLASYLLSLLWMKRTVADGRLDDDDEQRWEPKRNDRDKWEAIPPRRMRDNDHEDWMTIARGSKGTTAKTRWRQFGQGSEIGDRVLRVRKLGFFHFYLQVLFLIGFLCLYTCFFG